MIKINKLKINKFFVKNCGVTHKYIERKLQQFFAKKKLLTQKKFENINSTDPNTSSNSMRSGLA